MLQSALKEPASAALVMCPVHSDPPLHWSLLALQRGKGEGEGASAKPACWTVQYFDSMKA